MAKFLDETAVKQLSEATNGFAVDLYKHLGSGDHGNVFFSPLSIVTAMAMTHLGAKEATQAEMTKTFKFDMLKDKDVHQTFQELNSALHTKEGSAYVLHVANRLFAKTGYKFLEEYLSATRKHYSAEAQVLDFEHDEAGSRKTINAWVEENTENKIQDLIQPGALDPRTALVLVNAVYFKGNWDEQFEPEDTRKAPFTLSSGSTVDVDMMYRNDKFNVGFSRALNAKSIELPYVNNELSFIAIVPNKPQGLADLEKNLNAETIKPLLGNFSNMKVMCFLPRFKVEHQVDLKSALGELGINAAFNQGQADFSGMDGSRLLVLSKVLHKAFIEVNEVGSEAAAATAPVMMLMSMPMEFRADQPFLFLIRHQASGAIIFMGRVADPS